MSNFKLGKKPYIPNPKDLKYSTYRDKTVPITIPDIVGTPDIVKSWPMYGNDIWPDCAIAMAFHNIQLWNAMAGKTITFTDQNASDTYFNVNGVRPDSPMAEGTVMRDLMKYWQKTGITDADGNVHKIDFYVLLHPKDIDEIKEAIFLFGATCTGILFPDSAMTQFDNGQAWSVDSSSPAPSDGHAIPYVRADLSQFDNITWAKDQKEDFAFHLQYCDEIWLAGTMEMLENNCDSAGFLWEDMLKEVKNITR